MKKLVLLLGAFALIGCGEKNESGAGAVEAAAEVSDEAERSVRAAVSDILAALEEGGGDIV